MFENRNNTLQSAIKIADCLGRSLRENVQLFSLDAENNKVQFLTETGFVIEGAYIVNKDVLTLENLQVQDSDIFSDNKSFNTHVSSKVKEFVGSLHESEYTNANISFEEVIDLWETRLRFNDVKKKLEEKSQTFSETQDILSTSQFQKFLEVAPQIITWLQENKDKITNIREIKNSVKLSTSVANAFDLPKISISELKEQGEITFNNKVNKSVYEMLCRQELVAKELLESKQGFDLVWANNKKINSLAALIYSGDESKISEALAEALTDVPYLALASKKQLRETLSRTLQLESSQQLECSEADIKSFSSIIFEMKKSVKDLLIKTINEKYGVNVQNLKEVPSFRGLVEAQIVIFESLSRLSPKSSVIKDVMSQVAKMLREKSGVESIDVNDILQAIFEKAGYTSLYDNYSIADKMTLKEMFSHDLSPEEIVSLLETKSITVSDKIKVLVEKKYPSRKDEDAEKGYKGKKGGSEEAKAEEKKRKKNKDDDKDDTAEDKAEAKVSQYGEASEESSKEAPAEKGEGESSEISKDEFIKSLENFSKILGGTKKKTSTETPKKE